MGIHVSYDFNGALKCVLKSSVPKQIEGIPQNFPFIGPLLLKSLMHFVEFSVGDEFRSGKSSNFVAIDLV